MKAFDLSLYLVTESQLNPQVPLVKTVEEAIEGGVTLVQLREKNLPREKLIKLAKEILSVLKRYNIPLIINDSPEIAREVGAQGVHLGMKDISPEHARAMLGPKAIIGLSIESLSSFSELNLRGVDYLALSPTFLTLTKTDTAPPLGLEGIRELRGFTSLPLVAIGGVNEGNASEVIKAGADGIAVISALMSSPTPRRTAQALRDQIRTAKVERRRISPPRILTIAGSDSGGGAGIQADLKTFEALGCYGMSALTALTAQNTKVVKSIYPVEPRFVREQLEAVLEDIGVDAVKIGMLFSVEVIQTVAAVLKAYSVKNIVLDPVMVAKSGDKLLKSEAVNALVEHLFPLASIVTPNLPEAEAILSRSIESPEEMELAAKELVHICQAVVLKGGHTGDSKGSRDFFTDNQGHSFWLEGERIQTPNTHGTGCTYSSAIASYLGSGVSLSEAVSLARTYLQGAIREGAFRKIGKGSGPVFHSWNKRSIA